MCERVVVHCEMCLTNVLTMLDVQTQRQLLRSICYFLEIPLQLISYQRYSENSSGAFQNQNIQASHRSTIHLKVHQFFLQEHPVTMIYSPSYSTACSFEENLYDAVYVDFRILLPFDIVPPGFENCVPPFPAPEPWVEEDYKPTRKQRISMRPPPVLIDKCAQDLLAVLSPSLPPTPSSANWDGHDAVLANPAIVHVTYSLADANGDFECYSACETACTQGCERVDSVMKVEELMAIPSPSKSSVTASLVRIGHEAVLADPAIVHVAFSLPNPDRDGEMLKIQVSSLTQEERETRRSRSRSPGHAGFRCNAAQDAFERELANIPPPPERFLAKLRAKQN